MSSKKAEKKDLGITVKKSEDIAEWYSQVVLKSELADYAPVKGCMILRPNGYFIWEKIQEYFNKVLEEKGVRNAYFPMFIPESFFVKEAKHAQGFNPEVAWIERKDENEMRLAIRPTSETIIYDSYSRWIRSWRDLPLKMNQWCNIVRWETNAVKLLLRSREFLWHEGHCAYESEEECKKETLMFLDEYAKLCEDLLAIPVVKGEKTERERFAGAVNTYTIEALMPDGKALQLGTTHYLGQNFSKAFDISFLGKDGEQHYVYQNSFGFSTRLIGATVLMHSDDKGLVLPPKVAPIQVRIVPIYRENNKEEILGSVEKIKQMLQSKLRVDVDLSDNTPGWKFNQAELLGIPIRIELGQKDLDKNVVTVVRRDTLEKTTYEMNDSLLDNILNLMDDIHKNLYNRVKQHIEKHTIRSSDLVNAIEKINEGNWVLIPFCGNPVCEDNLREKTDGVTTRVIPFDQPKDKTEKCAVCGEKSKYWVIISRAY
ncbi:MAG: prolyl-tRNA synthetase [Candidatus Woesearchaeota archaeon]|nr:prolyl-tRNA synthetase [Candidatus Woesearchaeota archaeon]MDN5328080.1 prolyl-tRNA synthetase [Candidatus Woesearchaeota archaeon]